jgi:menaquinone-dependent protoporphyrinogen oxidase
MRVLVTAASKHGSTIEIAELIGATLTGPGLDVHVVPLAEIDAVNGYDAVVLGSAVYAGHWLKPAEQFVERHGATLAAGQVWLFSSGPIGEPPIPAEDAVDLRDIVAAVRAVEHRTFAGALHRQRLSFPERALVAALRAPYGDFRDWDAIRQWAHRIAAALVTTGA